MTYLNGSKCVFVWTAGGPMVTFTDAAHHHLLSLQFGQWVFLSVRGHLLKMSQVIEFYQMLSNVFFTDS